MCPKCKINEKRKNGSYCKSCHNEYQKRYYKINPASIADSFKRRKKDIRDIIINAKNVPCSDCGVSYPYYVMDFDHQRDKKFNISIAASKIMSKEKVIDEINKCDVVCANCHRERTFNSRNGLSRL